MEIAEKTLFGVTKLIYHLVAKLFEFQAIILVTGTRGLFKVTISLANQLNNSFREPWEVLPSSNHRSGNALSHHVKKSTFKLEPTGLDVSVVENIVKKEQIQEE